MIYLLGASGYVGQAYQAAMRRRGIEFRVIESRDINVIARHFQWKQPLLHPEFLINCAGFTGKPNVESCEQTNIKPTCLYSNAVLPGLLANLCEGVGVPWGHVSSGCIYSGTRPDWQPWREDDPPNFCFGSPRSSFYSGTKALGEQILAGRPNCYIWRMRVPFNNVAGPRNFLSKLMAYDRILDSMESLTELDEFCNATLDCWLKRVPFGTYNVVNPGSVTKREIIGLMDKTGLCRKEFRYWQDEAEFMRECGKTPRSSCVLDGGKLARCGVTMTPVHAVLERAMRNWQPTTA